VANYQAEAFRLLSEALSDDPSLDKWVAIRRGEIYAQSFDFQKAYQETQLAYDPVFGHDVFLNAGFNLARYSAIMNQREDAMAFLYNFYHHPSLYPKARNLVNSSDDFYHLRTDRRFHAWSRGFKRVRVDISEIFIKSSYCQKDGFNPVCDLYFKLRTDEFTLFNPNTYYPDNNNPRIKYYWIGDVPLEVSKYFEFWDLDKTNDDDFIGSTKVDDWIFLSDDFHKIAISTKYANIGTISFSIKETEEELSETIYRGRPSIGVMAWHILKCLSYFAVSHFVKPVTLKTALQETHRFFYDKEVTLHSAASHLAENYLKKIFLPEEVRTGVRYVDLFRCLSTPE
jgi:hypothetical protein